MNSSHTQTLNLFALSVDDFRFGFDPFPVTDAPSIVSIGNEQPLQTSTKNTSARTRPHNRGYPIAGATFTQDGYLLQKIAAANVGTLGFEIALLVRIYSGWGYVGSRLRSKVIEYEETGWYDGNFEPKTEAEMKRDKFLYQSDVQPAVERLKLLTLGAAALWVASCVVLSAANKAKPTFNEYDPRVLERVVQDDDFANAAAKASNGRPTYCDNRYYRAVANGGQGC